jgi:hypothetical protein
MTSYTQKILDFLGERNPVESLQQTTVRIPELAAKLGPGGLARPYGPGKWTGAQVLAHLADAEMVIGYRLRQALTVDDYVIQPFDQELWAKKYEGVDGAQAVATFAAMRRWNLALIQGLTPAELARPAYHPERGPEGVGQIIKMLAGHDLNHLSQLEQISPR